MDYLDLPPVTRMTGTVRLPGSKSISNRTLLLAALARGDTELTGLLEDSCALFGVLAEIEALGVELLELRQIRTGPKSP